MSAAAKRKVCLPLYAAVACFLAAGSAAAEDARAPGASAPAQRARDIAARELAFARKTAAQGDFRLSLSLYRRLVDHEPRNRRLRAEMEAVAARAPHDVRARFLRPAPSVATPHVMRRPVVAEASARPDAFRHSLRAFADAPVRHAPAAPALAPRALSGIAAPLAAPPALRAPEAPRAARATAAPKSPRARAAVSAYRATIAAPPAAPQAQRPAAPRGAEVARVATPAAASGERRAEALLRPARRAELRTATARAPRKPVSAPAPAPQAESPAASPHANDAPPRPVNERAASPNVASDVIAQAAPEPRPKDDLDRLFEALMRDPGNVGLNLRYARAAIDNGEPRKALPAYERVLAVDPANAEALAGIARVREDLKPDITQVTLSFGSFYESNPRHFRNHSSHTDAGTLSGRATLFDERRIRDFRWRTEGEAFFSWHTRFHDIDYGLVSLRGGPVLSVGERLRINPFIGGGYAWLKGRSFYLEVAGGATFEFDKMLPLHSVSVRAGYNDIGQHISTRDAIFVEVAPRLLLQNVGYQGTALWVNPYWRYNGVLGEGVPGLDQRTEPFPARAHQLGLRVDYFMPVTSKLTVGVNAGYEYRHFFEPIFDGGKNRRDHFVSPGAQAILTGLVDDRFGIVFLYAYEHRFSNDGAQVYSNHLAGVRLLWRN